MSEAGSNGKHDLSAEILHRHVDGELDAAGMDALTRAAALDPMVKKRLEGLVEVRAIVREAVEAQTPEIDSAALWSAIEAGLDAAGAAPPASSEKAAPQAPARPKLEVVPGGAKTSGSHETAPADPSARVRRIGAAAIGALAIAAVAWLALSGNEGDTVAVDDGHVVPPEPAPGPGLEPVDTEVLAVDFGTNIGTIFTIEDDGGDRYAVVWIDESDPRGETPTNEEAPD